MKFLGFTLCVACLLVLSSKISAQQAYKLREITHSGHRFVSTNRLNQLSDLIPHQQIMQQQLYNAAERILAYYYEEGYFDAMLDSLTINVDTMDNSIAVSYYWNEGKPSVLRSINFVSDSLISSSELREVLSTKEGSTLRYKVLEQDLYELLKKFDEKGFPFATIKLHSVEQFETDDAILWDIVFSISKHQQVYIADMKVEGAAVTRKEVITREARLQPNQLYTSTLPAVVQRRLQRLRIFTEVSEPQLYVSSGTLQDSVLVGGLALTVKEGPRLLFDGMVGYIPSTSIGSKGYFTGFFSINVLNLFGTARALYFRWFREKVQTQEIEVRYTEPWVFSYPVNLSGGLWQRRQDSVYIRNELSLSAEYMFNEMFSVAGSVQMSDVTALEGYGKSVMPSASAMNFGLTLKYDTRNNVYVPTEGGVYQTSYSSGTKSQQSFRNIPSQKKSVQRLSLDVSWYQRTFRKQVLAVAGHLRSISTSALDVSDLYLLGGTNSLRGYRENQFAGTKILWLNTEYRFLTSSRSYFFLFVDGGYYFQPTERLIGLQHQEDNVFGYGTGVRLESPLGFLGVTMAFGKGDTFSTAKLHFRVSNEL